LRATAALVLALGVARIAGADDASSLRIERLAGAVPAFALVAADGGSALTNDDLRGKTVLLHFWATWCAPCKDELAALATLATQADNRQFAVVLVAIDSNVPPAEVLAFARALGVRLPIYLATGSAISDSFWAWGVPVSYLIDTQGRFIGRLRGARLWTTPEVQAALQRLPTP
jgi:thiol-disulfide isomerase/thioredoxin